MQRCSKKAFAMCPNRKFCGTAEDAEFADDSECAEFNRAVENKPMTNADRIRAMSDEELAGFLMKLMHNNVQCFGEGMFPYHPCPQEQNCKQCGLDWLQQPAEEDDHA